MSKNKETPSRCDERRDNGSRLRTLFEDAPDAYFLCDMDGAFIDANASAEEMIGRGREELAGVSFLDAELLPPDQLLKAAMQLDRNRQGAVTGPEKFTLVHRDGSAVDVDTMAYPVIVDGCRMLLIIARRRGEEPKEESETNRKTMLQILLPAGPADSSAAATQQAGPCRSTCCRAGERDEAC